MSLNGLLFDENGNVFEMMILLGYKCPSIFQLFEYMEYSYCFWLSVSSAYC